MRGQESRSAGGSGRFDCSCSPPLSSWASSAGRSTPRSPTSSTCSRAMRSGSSASSRPRSPSRRWPETRSSASRLGLRAADDAAPRRRSCPDGGRSRPRLAGSFWVALAALLLVTAGLGVTSPVRQAYLHQLVPSRAAGDGRLLRLDGLGRRRRRRAARTGRSRRGALRELGVRRRRARDRGSDTALSRAVRRIGGRADEIAGSSGGVESSCRSGPAGGSDRRGDRRRRAGAGDRRAPVAARAACDTAARARHGHRRRAVGRRGQRKDRRPARPGVRPRLPLPGRAQRRAHDRRRRARRTRSARSRPGSSPGSGARSARAASSIRLCSSSELDELEARGHRTEGVLFVSGNAHLVMPWHVALDGARERRLGRLQIGTTRRGIGPAYADKATRIGIRVQDLLDPEDPAPEARARGRGEERLARACVRARATRRRGGRGDAAPLRREARRRTSRTRRSSSIARSRTGERVLFEGAQGTLLDLDHGTYPFVTSSSPIAAGAAVSFGIGPNRIDEVLGVAKAYVTRVGEGPFPSEIEGSAQRPRAGDRPGVRDRYRARPALRVARPRRAPLRGSRERDHVAGAHQARRPLRVRRAAGLRSLCVARRQRDGGVPFAPERLPPLPAGVRDALRAGERRSTRPCLPPRGTTSPSSSRRSTCRSRWSGPAPPASACSRLADYRSRCMKSSVNSEQRPSSSKRQRKTLWYSRSTVAPSAAK